MRENRVAGGTKDGYLGDNRHWLLWCLEKQPDYLTDYAQAQINDIIATRANEKKSKREHRVNRALDMLIKGAKDNALVHLEKITPE
jgi:hypothetical protein